MTAKPGGTPRVAYKLIGRFRSFKDLGRVMQQYFADQKRSAITQMLLEGVGDADIAWFEALHDTSVRQAMTEIERRLAAVIRPAIARQPEVH